jgi:hypothetical protein
MAGRQVYLTEDEQALLREAVRKWENWAIDDREDWEHDALESLTRKGLT